MPYSKSKTEYNIQYAKKNIKRIPLDVQKEKYEEIKSAALTVGETVNGYIKKAIDNRLSSTPNSLLTTNQISTAVIDTQQKEAPKMTESQTLHQEPAESESEAPHIPQKKPERQFKPFAKSDEAKINLSKLLNDIKYQMDIAEVYGMDVLRILMEQARKPANEKSAITE